jgi:hydrogenase maturation protease
VNLVIGIGNEFRRDDGAGIVAARAIAKRNFPDVSVITGTGDPATILDAWSDAPLAVVLDATVTLTDSPGVVTRWTPPDLADTEIGTVSSHSLGLADTYALGKAIGRIPSRLVGFAITVADLGHGLGLTPYVSASIPVLVDAALRELGY